MEWMASRPTEREEEHTKSEKQHNCEPPSLGLEKNNGNRIEEKINEQVNEIVAALRVEPVHRWIRASQAR